MRPMKFDKNEYLLIIFWVVLGSSELG